MKKYLIKVKNNKGAVALLLVIMIAVLTLVSSVVLSMANTADLISNYHLSEAENVNVDMDSCIEDAMFRISSSTSVSGSFSLSVGNISCSYEIGATSNGLKNITSTASTTSALGSWSKTVVVAVNVSSSPISIDSFKDAINTFDSYVLAVCGNGVTEGDEVCDDGNTTTETQTCGNDIVEHGTHCNADCSATVTLTEACDDGDTANEGCGNGVVENAGAYCNSTCTATTTIATKENCDYTGVQCSGAGSPRTSPVGCGKKPYCRNDCGICLDICF